MGLPGRHGALARAGVSAGRQHACSMHACCMHAEGVGLRQQGGYMEVERF